MKKEANAERPTPNAQRRIQKGHHAPAPNRQFSFDLDHKKLAADPRFAEVARELDRQSPIDSSEGFNRYCRTACRIWSEQFGNGIGRTSHQFNELLARVGQG